VPGTQIQTGQVDSQTNPRGIEREVDADRVGPDEAADPDRRADDDDRALEPGRRTDHPSELASS
jgi:hypothetical protein